METNFENQYIEMRAKCVEKGKMLCQMKNVKKPIKLDFLNANGKCF